MSYKVLYIALVSLLAGSAMAQDCTFFFPQKEGTQLIRRGYDAKGNLRNVMISKVDKVTTLPEGTEVEADFVYTDAAGNEISKGELECSCQNGEFYMDMKDVVSFPTALSLINSDVVITSDFMNYPNTFSDTMDEGGNYYFDDANIKLYNKNNKKERANVSIYNRQFVKNEKIKTPAGDFDCAKVSYNVDILTPKGRESGYGYEWYAPNLGVVRSEMYDKENDLQSYTVLEMITE